VRGSHEGEPTPGYGARVLVFSREVFVCTCSTDVPPSDDEARGGLAGRLSFVRGSTADLARVDRAHHDEAHVTELRSRLARDEHWLIGELDGRIATYTWLHCRDRAAYPSLPGCEVVLRPDVGYGYDAWTPPELRGAGLRRRAFVEELRVLARLGKRWEASFFVKHQLDGAIRSLARVGVELVPLWRIYLRGDRRLGRERLTASDAATPAWGNAC
jgi:hypothetical protein